MIDNATKKQKTEMNKYIMDILNDSLGQKQLLSKIELMKND